MNLMNVLYAPSFVNRSGENYFRLISVRLAVHAGYKYIFSKDSDLLEHGNGTQIDLVRSGELTWLPNNFLPTAVISMTRDLIHRRFGHIHEE
jgi:hypothetical protein